MTIGHFSIVWTETGLLGKLVQKCGFRRIPIKTLPIYGGCGADVDTPFGKFRFGGSVSVPKRTGHSPKRFILLVG